MKAIIPAIDISNGRCVRLSQGDFKHKVVYDDHPVTLAKRYVDIGAKRLHVVDLDAAFRRGNNRSVISDICKACQDDCVVEVGGGIRGEEDVNTLINMGVDRLCLGTILVQGVLEVVDWVNRFGNVFVGSLDLKGKEVQISGWQEEGNVSTDIFINQLQQVTLRSLVYTNVDNDGMLNGPDIEFANNIANRMNCPVILSGGIGKMEDISIVMEKTDDNIVGVVVGKAAFEGVVDLKDAFQRYPSPSCTEW